MKGQRQTERPKPDAPSWWRVSLSLALKSPAFLFGSTMWLVAFDAAAAIAPAVGTYGLPLLLTFLLRTVVRAFVRPGMLRGVEAFAAGGKPTSDLVFSSRRRMWPMLVAQNVGELIATVSLCVGALPGAVPVAIGWERAGRTGDILFFGGGAVALIGSFALFLYGWLGVCMAELVVAFENEGGIASLNRAWALARGNRYRIFKVMLFVAIADIAGTATGFLALGIGTFVTLPIARLAADYARVDLFDQIRGERMSKTIATSSAPVMRPSASPPVPR